MTAQPFQQRATRPIRREVATHRYAVGQTVSLRNGFMPVSKTSDIYEVVTRLPPVGNAPQYRIRNPGESHERVVTEDQIAAVDTAGGSRLIERTFRSAIPVGIAIRKT